MTPSLTLQHVCPGTPPKLRNDAAAGLLSLLTKLASGPLFEPSRPSREYRIPRGHRDEVVARVLTSVLEKSPLPVVGGLDGECVRYLQTMLVRCYIDMWRKGEGQATCDDDAGDDGADGGGDEGISVADLSWVRQMLDEIIEQRTAARRPRDRESLDRAYGELCKLVFDEWTFEDLLERNHGITPATPAEERRTVRDKLYQAHKRCRDEFRAGIAEQRAAGTLSAEQAASLERVLDWVLTRSQRPPCRTVIKAWIAEQSAAGALSGDDAAAFRSAVERALVGRPKSSCRAKIGKWIAERTGTTLATDAARSLGQAIDQNCARCQRSRR